MGIFPSRPRPARVENIDLAGFVATPNGELTYVELANSGYELILGATPFGSDGTFTGRNVRVSHPDLSIDSEGSWGGKFSTVDDSAGNPRRVAGTVGANGTTPGGSAAEFLGAFYGNTPQFEADVSR